MLQRFAPRAAKALRAELQHAHALRGATFSTVTTPQQALLALSAIMRGYHVVRGALPRMPRIPAVRELEETTGTILTILAEARANLELLRADAAFEAARDPGERVN